MLFLLSCIVVIVILPPNNNTPTFCFRYYSFDACKCYKREDKSAKSDPNEDENLRKLIMGMRGQQQQQQQQPKVEPVKKFHQLLSGQLQMMLQRKK